MPQKLHPAERYINDVLSGKIPACKYVKECYQRHVDDLAKSPDSGFYFNPEFAKLVILFFSRLRHYKGKYAGQPFILEPWQQALVWVIFGWRVGSPGGSRRFRQVYIEIPKKNGKTAFAAGLALYLAFFDGEEGAQVYTAATKRDQAKLCFNDVKKYIEGSPEISRALSIHTNNISYKKKSAKIEPLSNDHGTSDGIDVSCAVIDELHRHQTADMVDLLNSSTSARVQPLIFEITTAGSNKQTVCYEHRKYTIKVNNGKIKDEQWFGVIFTIDKGDKWKVAESWFKKNPGKIPKVWLKANPNLGTGKGLDYLIGQVRKARNRPSFENTVMRYDFNIWVGSESSWVSEDQWNAITKDRSLEELTGPDVKCYAGLDCATRSDFNALSLFFYHPDWCHLLNFFWCPKDRIYEKKETLSYNFPEWVRKGFITEIPGNIVDSDSLADGVIHLCYKYNVISIAFDGHLAYHGTVQAMIKTGLQCVEQSQAITSMSYPTKEFEKLILGQEMTHDDNPVMEWQMGNIIIYTDANENIKIHKGKSTEKVDGPVSSVMAIAEYLDQNSEKENNDSVYNERGFF